ncbi:hypothetical protein GCM10025857_68410 [Alicyclobacillus contaminans]|nr:hypothetical protein GCM10025857_68410 [Alicyclobacillus contaminans]
MQPLVPQGSPYTADQVKAALHAVHGSRRLSYTFDLLDANNAVIRDITNLVVAEQSTIKMDCTADDIKRSATFQIKDDGSINWLQNRIRPWAVLHMPDGGNIRWPRDIHPGGARPELSGAVDLPPGHCVRPHVHLEAERS